MLDVFTIFALVCFLVVSVYLLIAKQCCPLSPISISDSDVPPHTNIHEQFVELESAILKLNVTSNVLLVVPAVLLFIMGFMVEGAIVAMCAVLSSYYHSIGGKVLDVLDKFFACLTGMILTFAVIRNWQIRGAPTFLSLFLFVPLLGIVCYAYINVKQLHRHQQHTYSTYLFDRVLHALWHIIVAFSLSIAIIELQLAPSLIPNGHMRDTLVTMSTIILRKNTGKRIFQTLTGGALKSIFRSSH